MAIPFIKFEDKKNTSILDIQPVPGIIVEGTSDLIIYSKIFKNTVLSEIPFDYVLGNSKSEILKKYEEGIPFNFLAFLDSDYDCFNNKLITCDRLIYTHYYNVENYLTEQELLSDCIYEIATVNSPDCSCEEVLLEVVESIECLIVFSLLKLENSWPIEAESLSILNDNFWDVDKCKIDRDRFIEHIKSKYSQCITNIDDIITTYLREYEQKSREIYDFLRNSRIDYYVNGKQKLSALYEVLKRKYRSELYDVKLKTFKKMLIFKLDRNKKVSELRNILDSKCNNLFDSAYISSD